MQEWPSSSDDRSVASTARIVNSTRLYVTFLEDIDGGNGASIIIQKESPTLKALSVCNRNKERVKEIGSIGKKDRCAGNFPMFQCQSFAASNLSRKIRDLLLFFTSFSL